MMTVEAVRQALAARHDDLRRMGVLSLRLFGSVARGEARADSDVDLLAELRPELDLFDVVDVKLYLQDILGARVDLVEEQALRPEMRASVLQEAIDAG